MKSRNRTPSKIIGYGLYLYFLGLSFRNTAKALSFLKIVKISHVSIWKWIQKYRPKRFQKKMKIKEYIIDETAIKAGSELTWLWVIIKSLNKHILFFNISKERNMFVAERFLSMACKKIWNAFSFNRRWYLVFTSLQVFETNASPSFSL